jgi:GNAT superfamily N-acetyltransferase
VFIREFKPIEDHEQNSEGLPPGSSCLVKEKLIGHILATKCDTDFIEDASMEIPELDEYGRAADPTDPRGHKEAGRTIGIHSVVVHPSYRGRSIATLMLRDYIQRLTTQHIADRIALLAHDKLVPFYARLGFIDDGLNKNVTFGGGDWRNMWLPLASDDEDEDEQEA